MKKSGVILPEACSDEEAVAIVSQADELTLSLWRQIRRITGYPDDVGLNAALTAVARAAALLLSHSDNRVSSREAFMACLDTNLERVDSPGYDA